MSKKSSIIAGIIIGIAAIAGGIYIAMSLTSVDQGEVGVVWSVQNGVQEKTLGPGIHFVGPFNRVENFPVSQQQLVLSNNAADFNEKKLEKDTHVDAPADGGMVKMNMTVNYNFIPEKVTSVYEKFNGMDGNQIVESKVKNSILAYIKEVTPQFSVMDIYSDKRAEVGQAITEYLNAKLGEEYGMEVSSALIIDVQLDEELQTKVQAKEQAKQDAEKAELDKQTAIAQGEADKAKAEADKAVTITNAEAEAEANRIKAASITDELIKMTEAEARKEHGWVTVQGADTVVTDSTEK
ncbi:MULTISPECIES: prohibitin family protein [unclassified Blautia]|uniref:prohibitin family protein n=1 Tax=unclassified Blautia TaxID=2648079 RepID=UPI000B383BF4|nr:MULTISPECIES: prohibitin family protein [unclassified Blautia]OUN31917.1 membrane protease [Blautia sp. An81]OUN95040.1 membrane protease [Blautia sp. An46]